MSPKVAVKILARLQSCEDLTGGGGPTSKGLAHVAGKIVLAFGAILISISQMKKQRLVLHVPRLLTREIFEILVFSESENNFLLCLTDSESV